MSIRPPGEFRPFWHRHLLPAFRQRSQEPQFVLRSSTLLRLSVRECPRQRFEVIKETKSGIGNRGFIANRGGHHGKTCNSIVHICNSLFPFQWHFDCQSRFDRYFANEIPKPVNKMKSAYDGEHIIDREQCPDLLPSLRPDKGQLVAERLKERSSTITPVERCRSIEVINERLID